MKDVHSMNNTRLINNTRLAFTLFFLPVDLLQLPFPSRPAFLSVDSSTTTPGYTRQGAEVERDLPSLAENDQLN